MRRASLCFTLLFSLASTALADDGLAKTVADLAVQLGLEDVEKRDVAFTELVRLGLRAEAVVRAEMQRATDPEVRGRLLGVLQMYSLEAEERWAIAQSRKNEPFPKSKEGCERIDLRGPAAISDLLDQVREDSGIPIELYEGDPGLADLLAGANFGAGSTSCSGEHAAENALWNLLCTADVASVVDGPRVVIVRLTPAFLFDRLHREMDRAGHNWIVSQLRDFETGWVPYWLSARRFLQMKSQAGGPSRDAWFEVLRNRALDPKETESNRAMALMGLSRFLGGTEVEQPDVDGVFDQMARDKTLPASIRQRAVAGLTWGHTERALDSVLELLETGDEAVKAPLIDALIDSNDFGWTTTARASDDPDRLARLNKALMALSLSKSPAISSRALVLRAERKDADAQAALCTLAEPEERLLRIHFLRALHQTKTPDSRERFIRFAAHAVPEVRATVAILVGSYAGGTGRGADVAMLLSFLADPAPVVRRFAVGGLGTVYSHRASVRFDDGMEDTLEKLRALERDEKDLRVKEAISEAIKGTEK